LTSPSFVRWQHWLSVMYNAIGALCGCRVVKFDCNNLLTSVHTILIIILRYVRLNTKRKYYYYYYLTIDSLDILDKLSISK